MSDEGDPERRLQPIPVGLKVEVRNRFDGSWTQGFAVASVAGDDYRVVRLSDGAVLPTTFHREEIRRERSRQTWWV